MKRLYLLTIFSLLVALLIGSCNPGLSTSSVQVTLTASRTNTARPTITASATTAPQPSLTSTATRPPASTPTFTLVPVGVWQVPEITIGQWDVDGYTFDGWIDDTSVALIDKESNTVILDALSGAQLFMATPTPYEEFDYQKWLDEWLKSPVSTDNFEIDCSETGLEMVRLPDRELISRSNLPVSDCIGSVSWANNGSAASIVTEQGEVYVWRSDGSDPYWVGKARRDSYALWSPEDDKLLALDRVLYADEATFNIVYPDGKPMHITRAVIEAGNNWGPENLTWLTNDIVWSIRGCVLPNYCLQDYYHAESGKFLIRNEVNDGGGQDAVLSPDQRWLVMEVSPYADNWGKRYTYDVQETLLVLYDLKLLEKHVWTEAGPYRGSYYPGVSFEFIGWHADSSQFYFAYYPFGNLSADLPVGYSALDPNTLKTRQMIPDVVFTSLSPDGLSILIITADRIENHMAFNLKGAVYTLDGKPVTETQPIAEQLEFDALNPTDFFDQGSYIANFDPIPARWNKYSTEVVFAGPGGDLWLMSTNGETRQIASDLPVGGRWQENVSLGWSPNGQFLLIRWGTRGWIAQIHNP